MPVALETRLTAVEENRPDRALLPSGRLNGIRRLTPKVRTDTETPA